MEELRKGLSYGKSWIMEELGHGETSGFGKNMGEETGKPMRMGFP